MTGIENDIEMAAFVETSWAASVNNKGGWEEVEDSKLMLELMLSSVDRNIASNAEIGELQTLDLLGTGYTAVNRRGDMNIECSTSPPLTSEVLDLDTPLPPGWQKCLDLQTGRVYYLQNSDKKLPNVSISDTQLRAHMLNVETNEEVIATTAAKRDRRREATGSCRNTAVVNIFGVDFNAPPLQEAAAHAEYACENVLEMTTVGCAKCLMFVMLSTSDPRCPNCGSCAMLDFPHPVAKRGKHA